MRSPDLVVVAGDLTQRAKPQQFGAAREFLDGLASASLVVPGNHDVPLYRVWERALAPYGAWRRYFGQRLAGRFEDDALIIVGINTSYNWTTKHGKIRRREIDEVIRLLGDPDDGRFRIVVAHHPLVLPPQFTGERVAAGGEAALSRLAAAGVDLVLSGHVHQFFLAPAAEFYPEIGGDMRILHCGTPTSSRGRGVERGRNSCNWLEIDDRAVRVEQWMFAPDEGVFRTARVVEWQRRALAPRGSFAPRVQRVAS